MIDTHAHLDGEEFMPDLPDVIKNAKDNGVEKVFIPNINLNTIDNIINLCNKYKGYLYPMIGIHPEDVNPNDMDVEFALDFIQKCIEQQQDNTPFIAIGEVGLDFYWDDTFRQQQIYVFERQIQMAITYKLPLMIHSRKAHNELVILISKYYDKGLTGVFHCFTGNVEEAKQLLQFDNFMLGIGGVLTFKKSALPNTLMECVPLQRIVLETDAPYMAPVPNRGKRNEPKYIPDIALKLADIYDTDLKNVENITNNNVNAIFNLNV